MCKQKVDPEISMLDNLDQLIAGMEKIWKKLAANCVVIDRTKRPINGNFGMLFSDDDMGVTEKLLLRSYLNTTKNIAGCQALRARIGHILFGFRCVYGEVIFITILSYLFGSIKKVLSFNHGYRRLVSDA